jgi:transcriptional regulator with XRE-family HTH domain
VTRPNPTIRRRRLAAELRRLRKAAGISLEDAARHLDLTHSTLSRVETGQTGIRPPYVESLGRLYGVGDADREALVQLARDARQRGWWHAYSGVLSDQYSAYIGFETEATSIRTYEPQTVPGLLQTEGYARALTTAQLPEASNDEIEMWVGVRMARQERLAADDAPRLWAILGEPALRYLVGGAQVMREQLARLVELSELPHVTIQVLPYSAGAHPGMGGPFVILSFPSDPDVVHLENLTSSLYLEGQEELDRYILIYEHLRATASRPDESRHLIRQATVGE